MATTLRQMTALAVVMAITAVPASAQTPADSSPAQVQKRADKQKAEPAATPQQLRETAEDMEVLGTILHETLQREYKEQKWLLTWPAIRQEPSPGDVGRPLAARLPGYGVVFQLEAPLPGKVPEPVKTEKGAETGYPTRWERARRTLRGETSKDDRTYSGPGGGQTSEYSQSATGYGKPKADRRVQVGPSRHQIVQAILGVLAENGHHIRHLKAAERPVAGGWMTQAYSGDWLTVAVTFRKPQKSRPVGYGMSGRMMGSGISSSMTPEDMESEYGGASPYGSGAAYGEGGYGENFSSSNAYGAESGYDQGFGAEYNPAGLEGDAAKAETTGDLHLRQGKTSKAVDAYEKALRLRAKMLPGWKDIADLETAVYEYDQWKTKWHQVLRGGTDTKTLAVLQKLARAHLSANNYKKARQVLSLLEQAEELAKQGTAAGASIESKQIPVPARLVVAVMKADCDAVAEGKISRKQFNDRAYIEYFDPRQSDNEKKPAEQAEEGPAEEKVSERGKRASRAYALAGLIDMDRDGRSDVDRLREIVRKSDQGIVEVYIDQQGRRHGGVVDAETDVLVVGAAAKPDEAESEEQRTRLQAIAEQTEAMRQEARKAGVPTGTLEQFLNYLGVGD